MRIVIAGVHPLFCEGLSAIAREFERVEDIHILTGEDVFSKLHPDMADLFLLDVDNRHDVSYLGEVCKPLVAASKGVAIFTDNISPSRVRDIITTIRVNGVIPKQSGAPLVRVALKLIQMGERYLPELVLDSKSEGFAESQSEYKVDDLEDLLTPRQMEVLEEVGQGRQNQDIARLLNISVATVKLHVNAILQALGASNRTEAALMLYKAKEARKRHLEEQREGSRRPASPLPMPHASSLSAIDNPQIGVTGAPSFEYE